MKSLSSILSDLIAQQGDHGATSPQTLITTCHTSCTFSSPSSPMQNFDSSRSSSFDRADTVPSMEQSPHPWPQCCVRINVELVGIRLTWDRKKHAMIWQKFSRGNVMHHKIMIRQAYLLSCTIRLRGWRNNLLLRMSWMVRVSRLLIVTVTVETRRATVTAVLHHSMQPLRWTTLHIIWIWLLVAKSRTKYHLLITKERHSHIWTVANPTNTRQKTPSRQNLQANLMPWT